MTSPLTARFVTIDEAAAASGIGRDVIEGLIEYGEISTRDGDDKQIWLPDLVKIMAAAAIAGFVHHGASDVRRRQ